MANEIGSAYFTVLPSVRGLQGALAKEVSGLDGDGPGRTIGGKMGGGIASGLRAAVGPALAVIGAAKIGSFATDAVKQFSELEDSSAAAGVTFSGNMDRIIGLSKVGASSLGLSSQQVVNSAQMFGVFGKSAGLAGEDLESFAVDMTKLTGDLSSFSGKSAEDAITAVGAAMRGEFEPIRSFGVLLDDATLRQEALKMGLISTTKDALTPQQKTLAAQSAILKQTGDAQGDFARTSQSTANVAKTLAAESTNLSAKIGSVLAPAFTAAKLKAIDGVRGISGFVDKVTAAQAVLSGGGTTIEIGKALGLSGTGLNIFKEAAGAVFAFVSAFKEGATDITSSGFAGVMEGIGGALGRVKNAIVGAFQGFDFGALFGAIGAAVGPLIPQILALWQSFSPLGIILQALAPIFPIIVAQLASLAGTIGGALLGVLTAVMPSLQQLSAVLVDALGTIFIAVAPAIVTLLGQLGVMFAQLAPVITQIVTVVAGLVAQLISALMPILMELVAAVFPMVISIFGAVMQAIVPLVQMIAGLLIPIIRALLPVVTVVFQAVANIIRAAMQIVQGIIQVVTGIISGNWQQVWQGIQNILGGVWNAIVAIIRGAISIVGSVIGAGMNLAGQLIRSVFSGVQSFLGGVWSNIVNGVSGMIGNVLGFFTGLGGRILGALGNVGSVLFSAGANIVQGLIDGIGSMMGSIGRAVLSIVPEAIRGPFEALLGIRSPSRVAMWWGEMIGVGLVGGIDASKPAVKQSVLGLVDVRPPAQALRMAGSRTTFDPRLGELGLRGDIIDIDVHGDMFGNAREVAAELVREKKRAVAVNNIEAIGAGV